ncbi:nuclear transport factor 2 family protein [Dokdonella soli]|uniref:DUF4440 domain-containing protein n=1 Tax=Dokdonella soli TaxID=529810 RepID=A0ABN1IE34_9GAMM
MNIAQCLILAVVCCIGLSSPASASDSDEQAVLAFENDLCVAFLSSDAEAIAKGEDEHYTLTNSHSQISTRTDDITDAKSGGMRYTEFRNHDMKVRLYGDTAIVLGITSLKGSSKGKPFALDVRFTDTLVKRDGAWKLVAGHVTRLDKPAG